MITRKNTIDIFLKALKPKIHLCFIIIWLFIIGSIVFCEGKIGPVKSYSGKFLFIIAGLFAAFFALTPIFNNKIRKFMCRSEEDFKEAKLAFAIIGIIGFLLAIFGFLVL